MLSWEEIRSQFDRLHSSQVLVDDVLTDQVIASYQAELLNLYDRWSGVTTDNLSAE
ncbi:hypothetical protein GCM10023310_53420 [Paenibacillus vulneris]|uniref:Uncharacterized protein n=1 Tax=Paenibacillus vulneris TaxID=1133364 RepID=A0ABW3UP32_9BACL